MIELQFRDILSTKIIIIGAYIINFKNKVYVGSSIDILKRLSKHRWALERNTHRYSEEIGIFKESEVTFKIYPTQNYLELEEILTEEYKKLGKALNIQIGNVSNFTQTTKEKISNTLKGRIVPTEEKEKGCKWVYITPLGEFYGAVSAAKKHECNQSTIQLRTKSKSLKFKDYKRKLNIN